MADYVILKKQILDMGKSLGLEGNELTAFAADEMEQARLREKEKEESADRIRAEEARSRAEEEERTARIRAEEARIRAEEARMRAEEEERTARIRAEEDERTERRLQLQLQLAQTQNENTNNNSNNSGNSSPASNGASLPDPVVTIPIEQFDENQDLEEYINRFENLMEFHQLPRSQWSIKLSLGLKNMAFNIYNHLPPTDKADYDTVKASLFRYYQVTADNYRKKFKAIKRDKHETYKQVSTRLKLCLSKWLSLSNLDATYEDLVELIVSDQLMSNMSNELRTFIKENGGKRLDEIVELSDRYILARETDNQPRQSQNNNRYRAQVTPPPPPNYYGQSNHKTGHKPNKVTPSHPFDRHQRQAPPTRRPYCNNCKTNTHETSQCRTIKRTNTLALTKTLPVKENTSIQITPPPHQPVVDDVKVNGKIVTGLYDTGLDFDAVVSEELVSKEQYTTETLQLQCATYSQDPMKLPIANINIECPYVVGQIKAAVIPEPLYPIILGAKYVFLAVPKTPIHACPISNKAQQTAEAEANKQDNPESKQMKRSQQCDSTLKQCRQQLPLMHTPSRRGDYLINDDLRHTQRNADDLQLVMPSTSEQYQKAQIKDNSLNTCFARLHMQREHYQRGNYLMHKNLLHRFINHDKLQLVVPKTYRINIISSAHDSNSRHHSTLGDTIQRITAHYHWPHMINDIKQYVQRCNTCSNQAYQPVTTAKNHFSRGEKIQLFMPSSDDKMQPTWTKPCVVTDKLSNQLYCVKIDGKPKTIHISLLRKFVSRKQNRQHRTFNTMTASILPQKQEKTKSCTLQTFNTFVNNGQPKMSNTTLTGKPKFNDKARHLKTINRVDLNATHSSSNCNYQLYVKPSHNEHKVRTNHLTSTVNQRKRSLVIDQRVQSQQTNNATALLSLNTATIKNNKQFRMKSTLVAQGAPTRSIHSCRRNVYSQSTNYQSTDTSQHRDSGIATYRIQCNPSTPSL